VSLLKDVIMNVGHVDTFNRNRQPITTTDPEALYDKLISTTRPPALPPVVTTTLITAFEATDTLQDAWDGTHNAQIW
jgi:hypothetical protein